MSRYTLYYWPIPFRGEFVRALLRTAGQDYHEPGPDEVTALKLQAPGDQPVPAMALPVLVDHEAGVALSQMPAILRYVASCHGVMPEDAGLAALTDKIVGDANDVLDELTLFGGRSMWTLGEWETFTEDRLPRWMAIFEEITRVRGVTAGEGYLTGEAAMLADLVVAVLWGVMTTKLPQLRPMLERHAPRVAGLTARILGMPPIAALRAESDARWGDLYCGGQIEASIRDMLTRHGV
ncbi:MAG: glutathione S-transferase family protein [Pseudomonadota bacterium]